MDLYVDPDYAKLIIETNKLKAEVANRIVEKEWLLYYVIPEIKYSYILKIGLNELEAFSAKLKLDRLERKINLYKELLSYNSDIDDKKIEKTLDKEFKSEIHEYKIMQEDFQKAIDYTKKDKIDVKYLEKINVIYEDLVKKINPLINLKNSRLENDLYESLETAYKNADFEKIECIEKFCLNNNINIEYEIDELENLLNLRNIYKRLLEEIKCVILNIRSSEMFSNKTILNNEALIRRRKDDLNNQIDFFTKEYSKKIRELANLKKKKE